MFELGDYLLSKYHQTGRQAHYCCICDQSSIHSGERGWDFRYYCYNYYYKLGTREVCQCCLLGVAAHPSIPRITEKPSVEEEKDMHKKLLRVFKDGEYIEELRERRKIETFRERGDFYQSEKGITIAKLMGVQFENRQELLEMMTPDNQLYLSREPDNPYDKNAIAVFTTINNEEERIGYIPRGLAEDLASLIDSGITVLVKDFGRFREESIKYECISQEPLEFDKYWHYHYEVDMFIVTKEQ